MKKVFFIFSIVFFVVSCSDTSPKPQATTTPTVKSVLSPSPSPSPSPLPVQPVIVARTPESPLPSPYVFYETKMMTFEESKSPNFIQTTGSIPTIPGAYVIYANSRENLKYASLDGEMQGGLFDFSDTFSPFTYDDTYPISVHFQARQPFGFALSALSNGGHNYFLDDEYNILLTDLVGNPLSSWSLTPTDLCFAPYFSPQGNWIAVECITTREVENSYLNLVSLKPDDETKAYHLPYCPREAVYPPTIFWSSDDKHLLYSCPTPHPKYKSYCFLSVDDDEMVCKTIFLSDQNGKSSAANILSVSPDWSKIVLDLGHLPDDENGFIPGFQIYLADLECVVTEEFCDQGLTLDLPLAFPYDPDNPKNDPADIAFWNAAQLLWNPAKNEIVWMTSSSDDSHDKNENSHLVGRFDLATGETHIFERTWYSDTEFIGISPDGNWLLYYAFFDTALDFDVNRPPGYFAMSLDDGEVHYVAPAIDMANPHQGGAISYDMAFYGWLIIP